MKIKSINKRKRNNDCLILFADEREFVLSMDLVLKFNLSKDTEINEDEFQLIMKEQNLINAKQQAYNYASYKPRTAEQVKRKLKEKGHIDSIIFESLSFLSKFELINDDKFAKTFVNEYAQRKNAGPKKVEFELINKGIEPLVAKDAVYKNYPDEKILDLAMNAAQKKLKLVQNKPKDKKYRSIRDNLLRKGFDNDIIKKVISKVLED